MKSTVIASFIIHVLFSLPGEAQIKLPQIISDGLVLQRDQEIKIWGWASAREEVTLIFKDYQYQTIADKAGNWEITLPAQGFGGPYDLTLQGLIKSLSGLRLR